MTWLVTGGAGYIGAHVTAALQAAGQSVAVLDDLSTGDPRRVPAGVPLLVGDAGDPETVRAALRRHRITGVMHLAGSKSVPESFEKPQWYHRQNVTVVTTVLEAMAEAGVGSIVLSSSAAVYGTPAAALVTEDAPTAPLNPYGDSKLLAERAMAAAPGVSWVALRYFNAVGAAAAHLGDRGATNLLPLVFRAARTGEPLVVTGDAFATPDGTGVRDYVHVADLAAAHLAAGAAIHAAPMARVYNVGTGRGHSVLEVIAAVERVCGARVPYVVGPPRPGDPAEVIAGVGRIRRELGWRARHTLIDAVRSAWHASRLAPATV
ncbi:UDP-glucose 4-epimerase GalE [Dactylosporangium sp. NPDC048998]|uniref:UDP-glucose 4-epimerase GalE n=1 Tax=Dactylosporangium sp. NPDC048998 TaxID=3363976 RepID=UPI003711AB8A